MPFTQPLADYPVPFGYKCSWLAIRATTVMDVVHALKLDNIRRASWQEGITAAYNGDVFISPPISQWVLVVSINLPWPPSPGDTDTCTSWLIQLGQQFSEVQFFATHRVVETHAWSRVVGGVLLRQYAYSGEGYGVLWNAGAETLEEAHLRQEQQAWLATLEDEDDEEDEEERDATDETSPLMINESDVMYMASHWSIAPTTLTMLKPEKGIGYRGRLPLASE